MAPADRRPDQPPPVHELRLDVPRPFHADHLLEFLHDHVVPGVEWSDASRFAVVSRLRGGPAVLEVTPRPDAVLCRVQVSDERDVPEAVAQVRRLLDLDTDPEAVDDALREDPTLGPLVAQAPGLRVPGTVDAEQTALRTVVGQQVSIAGAATVLGRVVAEHGDPVDLPMAIEHGLTHAFPTPERLAAIDPETLPMPRSRGRTVVGLAGAIAEGRVVLDPQADRVEIRERLLALRGIGPWTADYVLMRGLGDPDVLLHTDLVLRRILQARRLTPDATRCWSPWRSYAGMHLWRAALLPEATSREELP